MWASVRTVVQLAAKTPLGGPGSVCARLGSALAAGRAHPGGERALAEASEAAAAVAAAAAGPARC